ncbi:MAG: sigma-70 family RNA polymerase sigma factor [Phycisphaerae bacterium]|nr:sigma-70 family RNA polymerase sigma factor [Saprospiraceae bacterium]
MPETATSNFLQLLNAHMGILYKIIRLYVDDPEDRNDLRQEILYEAWRAYPTFRGEAAFSTWLYRVALNTALSFRRKALRKVATTSISVVEHLHEENAPMLSPKAEILYQAIRQLPESDRAIITLHLDGYDNEALADALGLTKNHVSVKLHRIKTVLENKLINRDYE